jgi:hypothetical protein
VASERYCYVARTDALDTGFFSNSEQCPDDLPLRPDGCYLEQFEASGHRGTSRRKVPVDQMYDALTDERPDGISRRSEESKETELTVLNSAQSLLEAYN